MTVILPIIGVFFQLLSLAIFFRAILTWLPISPDNIIVVIFYQLTEPVLAPLRAVIPRVGMLDISPMVAIIILGLLGSFLTSF